MPLEMRAPHGAERERERERVNLSRRLLRERSSLLASRFATRDRRCMIGYPREADEFPDFRPGSNSVPRFVYNFAAAQPARALISLPRVSLSPPYDRVLLPNTIDGVFGNETRNALGALFGQDLAPACV